MLLMLNRPAEREAALHQFLVEAHSRGSSKFHKWITPEQFGELFGPADSDIQTATGWLSSHGFRVARVTKGKTLIEFSGSARNVKEAYTALGNEPCCGCCVDEAQDFIEETLAATACAAE